MCIRDRQEHEEEEHGLGQVKEYDEHVLSLIHICAETTSADEEVGGAFHALFGAIADAEHGEHIHGDNCEDDCHK